MNSLEFHSLVKKFMKQAQFAEAKGVEQTLHSSSLPGVAITVHPIIPLAAATTLSEVRLSSSRAAMRRVGGCPSASHARQGLVERANFWAKSQSVDVTLEEFDIYPLAGPFPSRLGRRAPTERCATLRAAVGTTGYDLGIAIAAKRTVWRSLREHFGTPANFCSSFSGDVISPLLKFPDPLPGWTLMLKVRWGLST